MGCLDDVGVEVVVPPLSALLALPPGKHLRRTAKVMPEPRRERKRGGIGMEGRARLRDAGPLLGAVHGDVLHHKLVLLHNRPSDARLARSARY